MKEGFFQDVYAVARLVPAGRVTSYGAIAAYLGQKRWARMVGWAMNGAPPDVPAHRVVNRLGQLTGNAYFVDGMANRLAQEGIAVTDNKISDFQKYFWDPSKELEAG